jgi:hypothetical protein
MARWTMHCTANFPLTMGLNGWRSHELTLAG